ncbi:MAG: DUF1845 family protein [Neisseriaceae bacterium]|nr:DUF1845 family protein [Neisseriaceae bacterium]
MENFDEKREIVIAPKSIATKNALYRTNPDTLLCEDSPFDDKYDYYGELNRLSTFNDADKIDHQADFDLLAEREDMLRHTIYRVDYFTRRTHNGVDDIDLDSLQIVPKRTIAGRLRNPCKPDQFIVHTMHASYLWFGRRRKEAQPAIGLFSAAKNLSTLIGLAYNGNLFAQQLLWQSEKELTRLHNLVLNNIAKYEKTINEYGKNGIKVCVFESVSPRNIEILMNRYVGNLVLLITSYDRLWRTVITLSEKSLLTKSESEEVAQKVAQPIRDFCEWLYDHTDGLKTISGLTRRSLLDNQPDGIAAKVAQAISENLLPPVSMSVLLMEDMPKLLNLTNDLTAEEVKKLRQIAIENKLVQQENKLVQQG